MLTHVNPLERVAVGRLMEILGEPVPWSRSLWSIGTVLAIDELYEACTFLRQGHLSEPSVKRMVSTLRKRIGKHPGFSTPERKHLNHLIESIPRADGPEHFGLRDFGRLIGANYLQRWGAAVAAANFGVEMLARDVAAHLLDLGFSAQHIHGFIKTKVAEDAPAITLQELCEALHAEVAASPLREFQVLIAFRAPPRFPEGASSVGWLRGGAVAQWLTSNGFATADIRAPIAKLLTVQARDLAGAAQAARDESDRYAARASIATGKPLQRLPKLWVVGSAAAVDMEDMSRGVSVKELFREDQVFAGGANDSVDAALEMLAHLQYSSPPAAVAGGWAAIEGLLADPSDRSSAADNLAALVTCSFPRAELTSLAYRIQRLHPEQAEELIAAPSNRERSRILAEMVRDARVPVLEATADQAAVTRMTKLLTDPTSSLMSVRESIGDAFHRLYRQRNLVLHAGRLDSVALNASLRTVAKLAGAGLDRITHAHYGQGTKPLELVARANLRLALIDRATALNCVDLLDEQ